MIKLIRYLLFPFSVIYGIIISFRNLFYNKELLKSTFFDVPIICVGNLSVGGTGKTPQIEYLIRLFKDHFNVVTLSRGYKRATEGFCLAGESTTMEMIGDEPYQYFKKYKDINIAVDKNRVEGVEKILKHLPETDIILLDDAYQHRKIKAGLNIMLSSYDSIFYDDFMLPTGNLREMWWGKKRADIIIITKCPADISLLAQENIAQKIKPKTYQQIFFTSIKYAETLLGESQVNLETLVGESVLLITGIAKPKPLVTYLKNRGVIVEHIAFKDHYLFTDEDIENLVSVSNGRMLITTEKDYTRLENRLPNLYYLPIETSFINDKNLFDEVLQDFVAG